MTGSKSTEFSRLIGALAKRSPLKKFKFKSAKTKIDLNHKDLLIIKDQNITATQVKMAQAKKPFPNLR